MIILAINDDGIESRGMRELVNGLLLLPDAEVYVIAPDRQRTCASRSITVVGPLVLKKRADLFPGCREAYSCSGTPADCAKLGFAFLKERGLEADLLVSGINHGPNVGEDIFFSGTVCGAMEGPLKGIPSVAFSMCNDSAIRNWDVCPAVVAEILGKYRENMTADFTVNVNIPDLPKEDIRGYGAGGQGPRHYRDGYRLVSMDNGDRTYVYEEVQVSNRNRAEGTDSRLVEDGFIAVSAVGGSLCRKEDLEKVRKMLEDEQ